ncbi:hypothetical protein [Nostoc sp.]|uniref:hypothetical protein n=1 Tax=Nostoc sp. TaxID=1180 RepID=UPI002FEE97E3
MAVDNHKVESVTLWLKKQNVVHSQVPPEDVIRETKKGLAVFNLVDSSIPAKTLSSMTKKFGGIIESNLEYQQKVSSLATRPQFLKPPSQAALSPPQQSAQFHPNQEVQNVAPPVIKGKPIPMNYPLMMHGDTNPIPVNTCQVLGKIYDLAFNIQQRDLTILQKNGEVILNLQSGQVQTNKLTPQILQTFEDVNTQIDKILAKSQTQQIDLQR